MNVVVTGGGTSAPIDDVRVISNLSTGHFAATIAEACLERGARVWHVHCPSAQLPVLRSARFDLDAPDPEAEHDRLGRLRERWLSWKDRLHLVPLDRGTVPEYSGTLQRVLTARPIDVAFLAMAVSDYEPSPRTGKIASEEAGLMIECRRTPKVIRSVRDWAPGVYLVGFKLLSRSTPGELIRQASLANGVNRADLTVANDLQSLREGRHTVHLVRPEEPPLTLDPGPDLARRLVDRALDWAEAGRGGRRAR